MDTYKITKQFIFLRHLHSGKPVYLVKISLFFLVFLVFGCTKSTCVSGPEEKKPASIVVGGRCEYMRYKGKAKIVSIRKIKPPKNYTGPSYELYEVKYSFSAEEKIKKAHENLGKKEYLLTLTNSWYPGPKFLQKYGIMTGKTFDCYLKVIVKGTCTPVIFEFPDIDSNDYFEPGF